MSITENYKKIRSTIPKHVTIVIAAKQRSVEEVNEVINAGATDIGENYVKEATEMHTAIATKHTHVKWHMIGNIQSNKINKALKVSNVIQTVDSIKTAQTIEKKLEALNQGSIDVFIEINTGEEISKSGIPATEDSIKEMALEISKLDHLNLSGIMTMGPASTSEEEMRPYFKKAKILSEYLKSLKIPRVKMQYLSMGMSNSYKVAIEEGSNMIRLGTSIFGPRNYNNSINKN